MTRLSKEVSKKFYEKDVITELKVHWAAYMKGDIKRKDIAEKMNIPNSIVGKIFTKFLSKKTSCKKSEKISGCNDRIIMMAANSSPEAMAGLVSLM